MAINVSYGDLMDKNHTIIDGINSYQHTNVDYFEPPYLDVREPITRDQIEEPDPFNILTNPNPNISPNLHLNNKYAVMGINPSSSRSHGPNHKDDSDLLLTIVRQKNQAINNQTIPKSIITNFNADNLIYEVYFNRIIKLFELDTQVKMFWEYPNLYNRIISLHPSSHSSLINFTNYFTFGNLNDSYIISLDFIYYLQISQQKVVNLFNKNPGILDRALELYSLQLQYYNPRNILIMNAYLSDIIRNRIYHDHSNAPFITVGNQRIFFLSNLRFVNNVKWRNYQNLIQKNSLP
jgi:hypothetical protein